MKEENPTKVAELFDRYRAEYLNDREDIGGNAKRQKSEESVLLREQASGSRDRISQHRMLRWEKKNHRRQR